MDAVDIPPDLPHSLADGVEHAADLHVVVIGAGMAGLVAALQCAKVGLPEVKPQVKRKSSSISKLTSNSLRS